MTSATCRGGSRSARDAKPRMSENTMVASSSSCSDNADGDASTSSVTSGGRKDASARANSARSFICWNRSPSPVWVARSVMSFWLAGERFGWGDRHRQRPQQLLLVPHGERQAAGLGQRQGLVQAAAL